MKPCFCRPSRSELHFAQRESFPRTHIHGIGGEKFGTYVDGFPSPLIVSSDLSIEQKNTFDEVLAEWGGTIKIISKEEALERNDFSSHSLFSRTIGLIVLLILWSIIAIGGGISRCRRKINHLLQSNRENT